MRCKLIDVTI